MASDTFAYVLKGISTEAEAKRLDEMHETIKSYMRGKLTFASTEGCPVQRIMDIGCGSGAWAIQAAQTFPNATVIAVDRSPLPAGQLPMNAKFVSLDLAQPYPPEFEPESFDIIHARLTFLHLANPEEVLARTAGLLKPGGWMLIDEGFLVQSYNSTLPPAIQMYMDMVGQYIANAGGDVYFLRRLPNILESSGYFSEVNTKTVIAGLRTTSHDTQERMLAEEGVRIYINIAKNMALHKSASAVTITEDLIEEMEKEFHDPQFNLYFPYLMTWSRRKRENNAYPDLCMHPNHL